jgi:hypothetical protein
MLLLCVVVGAWECRRLEHIQHLTSAFFVLKPAAAPVDIQSDNYVRLTACIQPDGLHCVTQHTCHGVLGGGGACFRRQLLTYRVFVC